MRKIVSYLALTLCVTAPTIANGAFVIRLKNGNEYVTNRYWQEGGQILFDADGGIFGVDKAFVNKIEKTDHVVKLVTTAARDPLDGDQTETDKKADEKVQAGPETKIEKQRDENDPIVGEFNRLKERAKDANGMLETEIRELLNQISAFRGKLIKDSKLFIEYGREANDISNLSNVVEAALRARTN